MIRSRIKPSVVIRSKLCAREDSSKNLECCWENYHAFGSVTPASRFLLHALFFRLIQQSSRLCQVNHLLKNPQFRILSLHWPQTADMRCWIGKDVDNSAKTGMFAILLPLPWTCLLYTSPSPRDATLSRMPSSA